MSEKNLQLGDFTFTFDTRPPYCDRGRYLIYFDYEASIPMLEKLRIKDFRNRFTNYFFDYSDAVSEIYSWYKAYQDYSHKENWKAAFPSQHYESNPELYVVTISSSHPLLGNYRVDVVSLDDKALHIDDADRFPRYYYDWDILVRETNAFFNFRGLPTLLLNKPTQAHES